MAKKKVIDHLGTYTFHGVDISPSSNGEATGTCPFCGKNKFYVNIREGTFCCKSANTCGKIGNKYTFLQLFYDLSLSITTLSQYKKLAKLRGDVSPDVFKDAELAYDSTLKRWIIPIRNEEGSIVNLRVWCPKTKIPMSTTGCKLHLGNLEALDGNDTIYICEGEWDAYCMEWLLKRNSKVSASHSSGVVSVPGSDQFKEEWADKFKGKDVVLLFDKDKAGKKGRDKTILLLQKNTKCKNIHSINWPESLPDKYDINDFVAKHKKRPINALKRLQSYLVGSPVKKGRAKKDILCKTFNSLVKEFRKYIHISDDMEDGILLICSVILSNLIPGEPLWTFLVGPAGCLTGDTELTINRAGKSYKITLKELHHKFNGGISNNGNGDRSWNKDIKTTIQSRNPDDGTVRLIEVTDVIDSGVKEVYEVELFDGKTIIATKDHRFLTEDGWKSLGELFASNKIFVNKGRNKNTKSKKKYYPYTTGLKYHPHKVGSKSTRKYKYGEQKVATHRLVIEAENNALPILTYISILRTDEKRAEKLVCLSQETHVHHKDGNTTNYLRSNLEACSVKEHFTDKHDLSNNVLEQTELAKIKSIKMSGKKQTFDICTINPHNFLANDIVVHNSGKTLLLQAFGDSEGTVYQSSLGAKTLISGWKTTDGSDPSLLPRIIGKTLVLKDYTELMSKPTGEQDEIYGQLRGAYDGHVARSYASGITREYPEPGSGDLDCRFSILAGVTNAIHGDTRASLGERFIKYQMVAEDYNAVDQVRCAIDNTVKLRIPEEELRDAATSFIEHRSPLIDIDNLPTVPQWFIDRIVGLSSLVATIRANVTRKAGELTYRPVPEVGTRLSKQLIKLGQCIAIVLGKKTADRACYSLISRVAMDTCYGWHRDVILALTANPGAELQRIEISKITQISPSTCQRVLDDLIELRALTFELSTRSTQGQPARIWDTSKEIKSLIKLARLEDTQHIKKLLVASSQSRKKALKASTKYKNRRKNAKAENRSIHSTNNTSKKTNKKKGGTTTKTHKKSTKKKRYK